jgi:uracil-DNA glycosylase
MLNRTLQKTGPKDLLASHIQQLKSCTLCPNMVGPVVTHKAVVSKIYLIGQAPGPREGLFGRPFAWTAGKTLFRWFSGIGINEERFRSLAYMAAVCRCFPGKAKGGGDRVPTPLEIETCSGWMEKEFALLKPELVIPVGRLAIDQVLGKHPLTETIGRQFKRRVFNHTCSIIPLPHPSGASTWFKREPGKSLLLEALALIELTPAWQELLTQVKEK